MKKNHKLTPEVYKQISDLSKSLPQLQKYECGKPMFRAISKKILGLHITLEERDKIVGFKTTNLYTQRGQQAVLQNHEVGLIDFYKKHGNDGIRMYCENVKQIVENFKEKQKN